MRVSLKRQKKDVRRDNRTKEYCLVFRDPFYLCH